MRRLRFRIRLEPEDAPYWPGPDWEPTVYDGSYPHSGGEAGDIYINRYKDPPLYYVFDRQHNCELVDREEIKRWVAGGLMKSPTPAPPVVFHPKSSKRLPRE